MLIVIASDAALIAAAADLAAAPVIAVDTEGDSFHSYWHRTCLLQISTIETDYVIDPLAADPRPLAGIFADPRIEKIMHAAENDVRALKRDYGFTFCTLFDTMVAARVLSYPRWGLADLLRDAFGVQLDKRFQRIDWAQRPLSRPALEYAAEDTHHLFALRRKLGDELHDAGHDEESQEEFARLEQTPAAERGFDPDDFWRVKGAREIEPALRPVLRELYRLRDELARRSNKPPFRVMPDSVLTALAGAAPKTQQEIEALPGISPYIAQRFGRGLLAAVARAAGQPALFPAPTRLDDAVVARYDALRAWRNARAALRKVEGDVILANSVLKALAADPPRDAAALADSGLLGTWKLRSYGNEIVALLNPGH